MTTILIIDDEPPVRDSIRHVLEIAKYQVLEAANGAAGIKLYREHKPSLVITDMLMPDKDGFEIIREIRGLDPRARIIVMSGGGQWGNNQFLRMAREFGAIESMAKPFRREELLSAVRKHLENDN